MLIVCEATMKFPPFVLSVISTTTVLNTTPAKAQNYPWCAQYSDGSGGAMNCAALRLFSSASQMSAELAASAHKIVHISHPRNRVPLGFDGAILIE